MSPAYPHGRTSSPDITAPFALSNRRTARVALAGCICLFSLWLLTPSPGRGPASVQGRPTGKQKAKAEWDVPFDQDPRDRAEEMGWFERVSGLGRGGGPVVGQGGVGASGADAGHRWVSFDEKLPLSRYEGGEPFYSSAIRCRGRT